MSDQRKPQLVLRLEATDREVIGQERIKDILKRFLREARLMKTDVLRRCVLSGRYPTRFGGDGKAAELVLVPIAAIRGLEGVIVIPLGEVFR